MKRAVVDTNVIASFLTDRNPSQQARAAALFEGARGALAAICEDWAFDSVATFDAGFRRRLARVGLASFW